MSSRFWASFLLGCSRQVPLYPPPERRRGGVSSPGSPAEGAMETGSPIVILTPPAGLTPAEVGVGGQSRGLGSLYGFRVLFLLLPALCSDISLTRARGFLGGHPWKAVSKSSEVRELWESPSSWPHHRAGTRSCRALPPPADVPSEVSVGSAEKGDGGSAEPEGR